MTCRVLGVYVGHDPGACLLEDGRVRVLVEDERLTRYKHGRPDALGRQWARFSGRAGWFPWASVTYCLRTAGVGLDELDALVVPGEWSGEGIVEALPLVDPSRILLATEPPGGAHHLRHALSTFFASPFDDAAVLVVDDDGSVLDGYYEAESGYAFLDRSGRHELVFKNRYARAREVRHGLGWMYHAVTNLLGFSNPAIETAEAGKTMGLAPYGRAVPELREPWVRVDGFALDFSGFERWLRSSGLLPAARLLPGARPLVDDDGGFSEHAANLAYKVQAELETGLVALASALRERTGARTLCLAGGVALNSVANEQVAARAGFDELFIVPAAGDNGQALGLAYHGHLVLEARQRTLGMASGSAGAPSTGAPSDDRRVPAIASTLRPLEHAYGGRTWSPEGIRALLAASGLEHEDLGSPEAAARLAAERLAQGRIVGWFQGGSEYGPRALGHRSILADPREPEMKEILNGRVKFREAFRPFAPSVLEHRAGEVFELRGSSPFMLRVVPVRPAWRERVPAITHVDGTARVQTVSAAACPIYHRLIEEFEARTGVPLVLNTSFNLRGMPIVESPWDALVCFLLTDMDGLFLDRFHVPPPAPERLVPSIREGWRVAVQRPLRGDDAVTLVATSPSGATSSLRTTPALAELLAALDGRRSVAQLVAETFTAPEPEPALLAKVVAELQRLARRSVLTLRTGALTFPIHTGPTPSPDDVAFLVRNAGMVSAQLIDR